MLIRSLLSFCS